MTTESKAGARSSAPCPGDNTLAAAIGAPDGVGDDVLGHLSQCASCQELVAELLRDSGGDDPRYRVEGLIGMGGMGLVLRAHDGVLDRAVALKLLWGAGAGSIEPALAEARTLARFAHPNIVTVHDAGLLEHVGTPFIAMELVTGETLREWLGAAHGWREIVRVFIDAGLGLHAAHEHGIVHADFKPANVLIPSDGGRARVTDFGLSRPFADDRTEVEDVAGTPRYLAPEQRLGAAVPASDQYAFGVALHEALWGRHPQLEGACPAPGCDGVPRRLQTIVARCLRDEPEQRYRSMAEVVARLRSATRRRIVPWLVGLAVVVPVAALWLIPGDACHEGVEGRLARWTDVLRPALANTVDADDWRRTSSAVEVWVEEWSDRAELSCSHDESPAVVACLEERWATLEALVVRLGGKTATGTAAVALLQLPSAEGCRRSTAPEPGANVAAERIARCAAAIADGHALLLLGEPAAAESALVEAAALAEEYGLAGLQVRAKLVLAKSQWQAAKFDRAFDTFSEAADLAVRAGLPDLGALAMGASAQYVAYARRDAELARRWLDQARAIASQGSDVTTAINLDRFEAWVLSVEGNNRAAADLMRSVIERVQRRGGGNALAQSTNREDLANFLSNAGQQDAALVEVRRSLQLRRQVVGPSHVMLTGAMRTQAAILQRADRFGEAATILADIATLLSTAYGDESVAVALAALQRADILMDAGRFDDAAVDLESATRVFARADSPDASKASLCEQLRARLKLGQGRPEQARAILQRLLEGGVQRPALSAQRVALIHRELGRAELALGNRAEAARWLRRAMDTQHTLDGTTLGELHFALARALREPGACGEASAAAAREAERAWVAKGTEHALARATEARAFIQACAKP